MIARKDWLTAGLIALAMLALYAASSPASISLEDDSLFVLSSYFLGIEHPPGYPLFTLIGHVFTFLPFGSVAYRVHLASALFGALTCAAAWLCARTLIPGRLPALLAALGLGLSPVFWSQATIAEVYTLNTFFFLALVLLALHACPADGPTRPALLPWMALVFGLSLSNHWPLMLLVAPAFAVLLWPLRAELARRFGTLAFLVLLGLAPYVWLVRRSWQPLPISFDGPLETLPELWYFISRAGYAGIDQSSAATWLDRIKFFEFQAGQVLLQFAFAGALVAAVGFAVQWRTLGRRVGAFLTIAFLMPSFGLLVLLGFDYDSIHKHVFHVYPLPAYTVVALWMGLGFAWLATRYQASVPLARAAATVLLALIAAVGAHWNLFDDDTWGARYAQALLKTLPRNAIVFAQGEADLGSLAYFHMIENQRPDLTLFHSKGLVLGNRLFHPLRTDDATAQRRLAEFVDAQKGPVVFTLDYYLRFGRREHWLFTEVDKSTTDPLHVTVDIPPEARRFFDESVAGPPNRNAWIAMLQGELRRRYATLFAQTLPRAGAPDAQARAELQALGADFYGALGLAEGLMLNDGGYSAAAVGGYLDRARELAPPDVPKEHLSRFFYLRGALRANMGDEAGALRDFDTAFTVWPVAENRAVKPLKDLYRASGNVAALDAVEQRVKRMQGPRR
ncbi:MAG TPA: DUF2723 domain-containing protein [Burkholderiales bacterium]|nr:DUF2723 domain-containing protein [Burkholderiales bacterium]